MPGGSKKLQRDAVEWILHFSPSDNPLINRDTTKISRRLGIFSEQYRKDKELKRTAKLPTKPHPKFTNWFIASPSKEDSKLHPAAFPLELILQLIPIWANEGDLVVDPFCGSGTTLLACKLLNRPCIGIDIKKLYCDRANERIGKLVYQDRMAPDFPQTSKEIRNYFKCSGLTYNDYILFVYIIDETIKHTTEPCRVAPLSRWRMSHCTGVPIQSVRNSLGRLAKHNIIIRYEDPDFPHTKNFSYLVGVHPDLLIPRHHERTTAWKQWIRRTTNQDGEERKE